MSQDQNQHEEKSLARQWQDEDEETIAKAERLLATWLASYEGNSHE